MAQIFTNTVKEILSGKKEGTARPNGWLTLLQPMVFLQLSFCQQNDI
jgi:hypothetical protein